MFNIFLAFMVLFKTSSLRDLEPKKDSEDLENILSGHKYQTFFTLFYFVRQNIIWFNLYTDRIMPAVGMIN